MEKDKSSVDAQVYDIPTIPEMNSNEKLQRNPAGIFLNNAHHTFSISQSTVPYAHVSG